VISIGIEKPAARRAGHESGQWKVLIMIHISMPPTWKAPLVLLPHCLSFFLDSDSTQVKRG
jgi:hypothetical protein